MANYAVEYAKQVDKFLKEEHTINEINEMLSEHLIQIEFFQHERLIHLIVTALFAVLDIIMVLFSFVGFNVFCTLLMLLFTVLLIPYVFHYYFLENSVQKMYRQYKELKTLTKG